MKNTIVHNGKRYVCKVQDNGGETCDRYTITFKAIRVPHVGLIYPYLAASDNPFHPQGFGQHGEARYDLSTNKNIGKRIAFDELPEDVKRFVYHNL